MKPWNAPRSARLRGRDSQTNPPAVAPASGAPGDAQPERNRSSRARARGRPRFQALPARLIPGRPARRRRVLPLHQDPVSRSRGPLLQYLPSLGCVHNELAEAIQRNVQAKEALQHAGKQVNAAAHELVLVQLQPDTRASGETNAVLGNDTREVPFAIQLRDALDLFLNIRRIGEIVEAKNMLQRLPPVLN